MVTFFPGKSSAAQPDAQASRLISSTPTAAPPPVTSTVTLLAHKQEGVIQAVVVSTSE